tara:strand:- start:12 stop:464 length:453 start_codon:yes stop_codon:yes gene_type:complete
MKMPALFSFLGGMASGYNAKKAAEADLAAKKEIKAQEAAARMDVAKYELGERRKTAALEKYLEGINEQLGPGSFINSEQRMELQREQKRVMAALGYSSEDISRVGAATGNPPLSQSGGDKRSSENLVGDVTSVDPVPTSGPRQTINKPAS